MSVLAVLTTIFASGIAGGIGGAFMGEEFLSKEKDQDGNLVIRNGRSVVVLDWWPFVKSLVLGALAAFVVPLFLVLAAPGQQESIVEQLMAQDCPKNFAALQSTTEELKQAVKTPEKVTEAFQGATLRLEEVIKELKKTAGCTEPGLWWSNLLVLIGFCAVAALVAPRFLSNIADKLLKETKEAKEDAKKARSNSQVALDATRKLGPSQELDETAKNVLKAFVDVPEWPASIADVAKLVELDDAEVSDALDDLMEGGFVMPDKKKTSAWHLRGWGKMRMREEIGLSNEDVLVLSGIKDLPEKRPTAEALAERLNLSLPVTKRALQRIERFGLIAPSTGTKGGWRVRSWGKFALGEARNN